jgi:acyl-ACP thioesterase
MEQIPPNVFHRNQPSQRQTGDSHGKPFEIRLDEIDFNGHLHNTK